MSDLYLTILRATGESDSGQVKKAGKWAADEIEGLQAEIARLRKALMYCGGRMEHPRCPRCADTQQVAREALADMESSDE